MENQQFKWENSGYMAIFNSYVKVPEGTFFLRMRMNIHGHFQVAILIHGFLRHFTPGAWHRYCRGEDRDLPREDGESLSAHGHRSEQKQPLPHVMPSDAMGAPGAGAALQKRYGSIYI